MWPKSAGLNTPIQATNCEILSFPFLQYRPIGHDHASVNRPPGSSTKSCNRQLECSTVDFVPIMDSTPFLRNSKCVVVERAHFRAAHEVSGEAHHTAYFVRGSDIKPSRLSARRLVPPARPPKGGTTNNGPAP